MATTEVETTKTTETTEATEATDAKPEATEAKPDSKTAKKAAAAAAAAAAKKTAALATEFERGMKASLGRMEKVEKQTYYRLMKDGKAVVYVHTHKNHIRVTLGATIGDSADIAKAVEGVLILWELEKKFGAGS